MINIHLSISIDNMTVRWIDYIESYPKNKLKILENKYTLQLHSLNYSLHTDWFT